MNRIIEFTYGNYGLRTVLRDGAIWFIAKDVCAALDISNPTDALKRLDDDERSIVNLSCHNTLDSIKGIMTSPGNPNVNVVNEFGLYNLILGSRKTEAKAFKRWVTHEVLPAIRKDGVYCQNKPGMSIEYKKQVIMIEALMDERKNYLEMNREIIKQVKLLEKRVCELEDRSGMFARSNGKPSVCIGSTNTDECKSLFVEFAFSGAYKSFAAMNTFLQELEGFLVEQGYHKERKLV